MMNLKDYISEILTLNEKFINANQEDQKILMDAVMNGPTDENRDELARRIMDLDMRTKLTGELIKVVEKFMP